MNQLRIDKLRQALIKGKSLEAMVILNRENRFYLSGFDTPQGILLVTFQEALLILAPTCFEEARRKLGEKNVTLANNTLSQSLFLLLQEKKIKRVGYEATSLTNFQYREWKRKLRQIKLFPLEGIIEKLRLIKDEEEIEAIRKASAIATGVFREILNFVKEGMTEKEIADEIEYRIRKKGGARSSFETIVASGYRSSYPHGVASSKKIKKGEIIVLDFGVNYQGYNSDLTRVVSLGKVPREVKLRYQMVLTAQQRAIDRVRKGVRCKSLDRVAREYLKEKNFGKYFVHGLGHGVGLNIHESPFLRQRENTLLERNMVITVEPGVYFPSEYGLRVEDVIVVKTSGFLKLTTPSRRLIEI